MHYVVLAATLQPFQSVLDLPDIPCFSLWNIIKENRQECNVTIYSNIISYSLKAKLGALYRYLPGLIPIPLVSVGLGEVLSTPALNLPFLYSNNSNFFPTSLIS